MPAAITQPSPSRQSNPADRTRSTTAGASARPIGERSTNTLRRVRRRRVGRREVLNFTTQLSIMSRAGLDLASSLASLSRQCRHPGMQAVIEDVNEDVTGGKRVSESLRRHVDVFGETYVASVAAGEASGRLPEVLDQLARLQRSEMRLRGSIRTLLAYPVLLSSVSSVVVLALILFVLPQFATVFADYEMSLPFVTKVLLAISHELRHRFWLWGVLAIGLVTGLFSLRYSRSGRRLLDTMMLNTRCVREVTRALLIGRSCRLMSIMIGNGVPLLDCIRLVRASVRNSLYQDLFTRLEHDVLNGNGLGNCLLQSEIVPASAAEMVVTAERTGTLAMVTELLGEHYEDEAECRLRELVAVLEPAITVGMGSIVAVVVTSVMLPMFDMATMAQRAAS